MQYCSLQHWTLLLSPVTSTTGCCFCLAPSLHSFWSYFPTVLQEHIGHLPSWGVHLSVSYLSAFSYCLRGSEKLYKKDLHDPDNHNGVISHLEPDILECEVKWALVSITMNKASGCDGIPAELFQILKDDAVKVLHSICQQIWRTQQWPQTGKGQFSFQSQRKAMPKNAQTNAQLHSSHTLVK